jgi:hypothetical protein
MIPSREFGLTSPIRRAQTIVQTATLFSQLFQHFPVPSLSPWYKKHTPSAPPGICAGRHFVAMLVCQLGRPDSLREICNGLTCCLARLVHLGISKAPSRSTLSYMLMNTVPRYCGDSPGAEGELPTRTEEWHRRRIRTLRSALDTTRPRRRCLLDKSERKYDLDFWKSQQRRIGRGLLRTASRRTPRPANM